MINAAEIFENTLTYRVLRFLINESKDWFESLGEIGLNFVNALKYIFIGKINLKRTIEQASRFGVDSLPLSLTMAAVSGMIIALQLAYEMVKQGAGSYVGRLVTISIIREVGPIMGGFAVISMVGSAIAAEIGTMKITEQIDAMKILKIDPIYYLLVPRIIAGFFIMPFVIILADVAGVLGGMLSSNIVSGLGFVDFIDSVWIGLSQKDILVSLLKGCVFGGIISLVSCSMGYRTHGGAIDVGRATNKAVVWSFVAIVVVDYIISLMFFD